MKELPYDFDERWATFKPNLKQVFDAMTDDETEIGSNPDWNRRILETASSDQIAIVNAALAKSTKLSEVAWELGFFDYE